MSDELRTDFHALLDEVSETLVEMGAMVAERTGEVTVALLSGDVVAADRIIELDDDLDLLSLEAEEKCVELLALQQPVAVDLRTILTNLHMVGELERSGDLVTNIAKAVVRISGVELSGEITRLVGGMCDQAKKLMGVAIDCYVNSNASVAATVAGLDDVLDGLQRDYLDQVFSSSKAGELEIRQAVQLAVIGRFYERIGDHAVNIAERVMFLVTGIPPEHAGASRARQRREDRLQAGGSGGE